MTDTTDPYADDIEGFGPTDEQLRTVVALANHQIEAEDLVARLTADLKAANEDLRRVSEADLPEALNAAGLDAFTLTGGRKVGVETKVFASINKENQDAAFSWLEDAGHGDLIKRDVSVTFGKGQGNFAEKLLTFVRANFTGQKFADKRSVHPQTLGAFVREQLSAGTALPESIGVATVRRAVITRQKEESL